MKVTEIDPDTTSTWEGRKVLAIDVDWASDDVLEMAVELIIRSGISATWFMTHDTKVASQIQEQEQFEIGIHPNFNTLLDGTAPARSSGRDVIAEIMDVYPQAKAVRSHSLTSSSRLTELFLEFGLTHECNTFIPFESGIAALPFRGHLGMIQVPFSWEDDVWFSSPQTRRANAADVWADQRFCAVDFHPIHLAMDTANPSEYLQTKRSAKPPRFSTSPRIANPIGVLREFYSLSYDSKPKLEEGRLV